MNVSEEEGGVAALRYSHLVLSTQGHEVCHRFEVGRK